LSMSVSRPHAAGKSRHRFGRTQRQPSPGNHRALLSS
jgi:hypothetical protein